MTTTPTTIDAAGWLRNHLESDDAGGDLLAALVKDFAEALMSAEASAQCQAGYNERTDQGVSTRRIDDVVQAMGIEGMSPSQVSRLSADLDVKVTEFRERPLDAGPYRYVWIDRPHPESPRGRPGRERLSGDRDRGERRGSPRGHRVRHCHDRVDSVVDRVPAGPGRPSLVSTRDLRRPRRHAIGQVLMRAGRCRTHPPGHTSPKQVRCRSAVDLRAARPVASPQRSPCPTVAPGLRSVNPSLVVGVNSSHTDPTNRVVRMPIPDWLQSSVRTAR
jgi:hypothetical protein